MFETELFNELEIVKLDSTATTDTYTTEGIYICSYIQGKNVTLYHKSRDVFTVTNAQIYTPRVCVIYAQITWYAIDSKYIMLSPGI